MGKYHGFQTMRFVGLFSCDGEGQPLAIGRDNSAATDALIRKTMQDDEITFDEARAGVERRITNGDVFHAPIALRGAFQNDGNHEGSKPESWWIDAAFR